MHVFSYVDDWSYNATWPYITLHHHQSGTEKSKMGPVIMLCDNIFSDEDLNYQDWLTVYIALQWTSRDDVFALDVQKWVKIIHFSWKKGEL